MNHHDYREDDADYGDEYEHDDTYADETGSDETGAGDVQAHMDQGRADESYGQSSSQPHEPEAQHSYEEGREPVQESDEEHPRESRKERRRREAQERQARAEAEAAALAASATSEAPHDADGQAVEEDSNSHSGMFGRLFGKNRGEQRMDENRATPAAFDITLPSAERIDPNALFEFGLDPNTLSAMGMDPATLPQFEPEFLVELGINPQIVMEILRRQHISAAPEVIESATEPTPSDAGRDDAEPRAKFDMSPAAWIGRYRKFQKWAPAAAALAGLTTTGSIWFLSGDTDAVPKIQSERPAADDAEKPAGEDVAQNEAPKNEANEPQPEPETPPQAAQPVADNAPTDSAAEPTSLAMNDLPSLPGTDPKPEGAAAKVEPPGALTDPVSEPGDALPVGDALPSLPGVAETPAPATPVATPLNEPAPEKSPSMALPAIGGLGAAALAAEGLSTKADGLPLPDAGAVKGLDLPNDTAKPPAESPPGLGTPIADASPGGEAPPGFESLGAPAPPPTDLPGLPAPPAGGLSQSDAPPDLPSLGEPTPNAAVTTNDAPAPPAAETANGLPLPVAEAPPSADLPGLPKTSGVEEPAVADASAPAAPELPAPDTKPKSGIGSGKAALAGLAAGLGAAAVADAAKPGGAQTDTLPTPVEADTGPMASSDLPTLTKSDPPAESPPGSLANLPKDIPQTPSGAASKAAEAAPKPAETRGRMAEADASWPSIPNSRGKMLRSLAGVSPVGRSMGTSAAVAMGAGAGIALGTAVTAIDGSGAVVVSPPPAFESATTEIAPIKHTVQSGENFWTISRDYYGSGRYYKALWAANADKIGKIDELHVGDAVKIPAMEYLDKSLIDTPKVARSKRSAVAPDDEDPPAVARSRDAGAVRTRREIESIPIGENSDARPTRGPAASQPASPNEIVSEPIGETASTEDYVRHRVQPGETLRTIAADRLGSARRDDDIVALNPDVLDDVRTPLEPGMVLKLPAGSRRE